jgi:hypothetical protein
MVLRMEEVVAQPPRGGQPEQPGLPRVPEYAWAWLQRSRPVLSEIAVRLTGAGPTSGFVQDLRRLFRDDAFSRDVVLGAIVDIAFRGRVPGTRPPGASWDRGLVWWAAAATGRRPADFDRSPAAAARERRLFDPDDPDDHEAASVGPPGAGLHASRVPRRTPSGDRAELVWRLRALLRTAEGGAVPVAALQELLADLEGGAP